MKYHVHFKNEHGRDDSRTVEAADEITAEVLVMNQNPTALTAIGAYPAEWVSAAGEEQGRAR
jgi:hypothetical protein